MNRMRSIIVALLSLFVFATTARADINDVSSPVALTSSNPAAVIEISGKIDDFERDAMIRRFDRARAAGAKTVIVEIDTYGGLVTSALEMSSYIKRQTDLHTIAFVRGQAISAGAMIAMACDEIVMQHSSKIGDCAPIVMRIGGSIEPLPPTERAKHESPVLAEFRDSARDNNHDTLLAEAMVTIGPAIHYVESTDGEKRFVPEEHVKMLLDAGWKHVESVPNPLHRAGELLTLPSRLATQIGLSKGEFASADALAEARGLSIVARLERGMGESIVQMLGTPVVRLLLLVLFVMSLKIALSTPGHGAPEAVAVVSLGVLLGVPLLTGYAQWWEICVVLLGIALLAFEIFVLPGHLVSGILGVLMIIFGLVMTFAGREAEPGAMPTTAGTIAALQNGLLIVTLGLVCSLALWVWLGKYLPKLPYLGRLVLATPGGDPTMSGALGADMVWPLVGATGRAVTDLKPGGTAEFRDETLNDQRLVSVLTDGAFVRAGATVVVTESRGNRVVVRTSGEHYQPASHS